MKTTARSFLYWSMSGLFFLYEMILRASSSVMANELRADFILDAKDLGLLSSMYYWAYTPLQLPCGLILDKLGARRLITLSCLLCALGALLFGLTHNIGVASLARFLMGMGSACAFISSITLIMGWFSSSHFVFMTGITNLMGCLGGIFAGEPLAWLTDVIGWRKAMVFLSAIGFGLSFLVWVTVRDVPSQEGPHLNLQLSLFEVLKKRQLWLSGIIGGLLYLPISVFAELWAVPFLQATYHVTAQKASLVPMAIYIGMGIGGTVAAYICHQFQSYRLVLQGTSLLAAFLFCMMAVAQCLPFPIILSIAAFIGLVVGGQVLVFSVAKDHVPLFLSGTTAAFTNALIMSFPLTFQPLFGALLNKTWALLRGTKLGLIPVYNAEMYKYAIFAFPACFALSFLLSFLLKETYPRSSS